MNAEGIATARVGRKSFAAITFTEKWLHDIVAKLACRVAA
jgi:hypothetical protein